MVLKKKKKELAKKKKSLPKKPCVKKIQLKKKPLKKKLSLKQPKETVIGEVTHYFPKVNAAVIKLRISLLAGEEVKIKGKTTDFSQKVVSMQIDHVPVTKAKKGDEIGLLVDSRVRSNDVVYKA